VSAADGVALETVTSRRGHHRLLQGRGSREPLRNEAAAQRWRWTAQSEPDTQRKNRMSNPYNPKHYWEHRLNKSFNLKGVGHIGFSESYNSWLYRRKKRCIESCLRDTPLKDKDILDVGCGTGFFVEWYLKRGANVVGIDITDVSITNLRQRYRGEFFTQDITASDYRAYREFDIVNMWDVIYHIVESHSFNQALDNVSRSLKQGGLFLFTDWFGAFSDVRIADHVQARCLGTYQKILAKKGFELIGIYPLYNTLNRTNLKTLDNYLACVYFLLDNLSKTIPHDNLSLSVWRHSQPRK
jgi:2-polyprenyl-3-methyl-5-hydroxy-6-metoxy-1,4-benzoquinol methylase